MGFDLSGNNPQININIDEYENYHAIESLNYTDKWTILDSLTENERSKYYDEQDNYYESNPGIYFRNNCWWWRPLWTYTVLICNDIMTEDDVTGGAFNNGHKINKTKANKMASLLQKSIKSGEAAEYEDEIKKQNEKAAKSKDKSTKFLSNYPFSVENVERFIKFLKQSGGFLIC